MFVALFQAFLLLSASATDEAESETHLRQNNKRQLKIETRNLPNTCEEVLFAVQCPGQRDAIYCWDQERKFSSVHCSYVSTSAGAEYWWPLLCMESPENAVDVVEEKGSHNVLGKGCGCEIGAKVCPDPSQSCQMYPKASEFIEDCSRCSTIPEGYYYIQDSEFGEYFYMEDKGYKFGKYRVRKEADDGQIYRGRFKWKVEHSDNDSTKLNIKNIKRGKWLSINATPRQDKKVKMTRGVEDKGTWTYTHSDVCNGFRLEMVDGLTYPFSDKVHNLNNPPGSNMGPAYNVSFIPI
uniref:Uncharacterized protein n=1 Tax=Grammatophora oceanica TaxID=210454 RepID=A0A7S1UQW6_9STRA|mmetsp:Transcript_18012/g.26728  ORF Transcript_18012/g.26728 Transcript_18012/m.26728 type:complete len:294 (+) Transcript_18012:382-1263(+)|eukprot:CAMPEP_0194029482 /NCGR_PEP_ID=MMETSP0009_2-20130614/3190_1 /TAXON_ID=210454 /ORGANISM="Grammatophora oceanica, Strain CCMP 410" /LENGTH=293 /DNA_ID=CAMNT_0038669153 /DNA_START=380 /DNA_END=1261 /DNA_ORIENTATION=-